jgi:hypothetical protein
VEGGGAGRIDLGRVRWRLAGWQPRRGAQQWARRPLHGARARIGRQGKAAGDVVAASHRDRGHWLRRLAAGAIRVTPGGSLGTHAHTGEQLVLDFLRRGGAVGRTCPEISLLRQAGRSARGGARRKASHQLGAEHAAARDWGGSRDWASWLAMARMGRRRRLLGQQDRGSTRVLAGRRCLATGKTETPCRAARLGRAAGEPSRAQGSSAARRARHRGEGKDTWGGREQPEKKRHKGRRRGSLTRPLTSATTRASQIYLGDRRGERLSGQDMEGSSPESRGRLGSVRLWVSRTWARWVGRGGLEKMNRRCGGLVGAMRSYGACHARWVERAAERGWFLGRIVSTVRVACRLRPREKIGSGTHMVFLSSIFSTAQDAPMQAKKLHAAMRGVDDGEQKKRRVQIYKYIFGGEVWRGG